MPNYKNLPVYVLSQHTIFSLMALLMGQSTKVKENPTPTEHTGIREQKTQFLCLREQGGRVGRKHIPKAVCTTLWFWQARCPNVAKMQWPRHDRLVVGGASLAVFPEEGELEAILIRV